LPKIAAARKTEPAQLAKLVRGELDWIVMKSLEKDRNLRYQTANDMAQEVQRYLSDEPVQAGPPSAAYRLRKFVKRNRGAVLAASVVLLTLLAGISGTTWGLLEALHQGDISDQARKVADDKAKEAKEEEAKAIAARKDAVQWAKDEEAARKQVEQEQAQTRTQFHRAEMAHYAFQIHQAKRELERGNFHGAMEILDDCRWHLRGWEHAYLQELCRRKCRPVSAVEAGVPYQRRPLALNANGEILAVGNFDVRGGTVTLYQGQMHKVLLTLQGPEKLSARHLAFGPDGKRLLAVFMTDDGSTLADQAILWDLATTRILWSAKVGRNVDRSISASVHSSFSADGKRIALAATKLVYPINRNGKNTPLGHVQVQETGTGKILYSEERPSEAVHGVSLDQDGQNVAVHVGTSVEIREVSSGKIKKSFPGEGVLLGYDPQGKELLLAEQKPLDPEQQLLAFWKKRPVWHHDRLIVRDLLSGKEKLVLAGLGALPVPKGYSHQTGRLVAELDRVTVVWDVRTGKKLGDLASGSFGAFSRNGQRLAIHLPNYSYWREEVGIWDVTAGREMLALGLAEDQFIVDGHNETPVTTALSPNGKLLASAGGGRFFGGRFLNKGVILWDAVTGAKLRAFPGEPRILVFSPDNQFLAAVGPGVTICNVATGEVEILKGANLGNLSLSLARFSHDGRYLAVADDINTCWAWDLVLRKLLIIGNYSRDSRDNLPELKITPDGLLIFMGPKTGEITAAWNLKTAKALTGGLHRFLTFSPDFRRVCWAVDIDDEPNKFLMWDVAQGKTLFTRKGVFPVSFSPDGKYVILSRNDKVLDASTGAVVPGVKPPSLVRHIVDPGQRYLVFEPIGDGALWEDGGRRVEGATVHEARTGKKIVTLQGVLEIERAETVYPEGYFTDDGRWLVHQSAHRQQIWNVQTGKLLIDLKIDLGGRHPNLSISPDGNWVAAAWAEDRLIFQVWNTLTGKLAHEIRSKYEEFPDSDGKARVIFSLDGKRLVSSHVGLVGELRELRSSERRTQMWDTETGQDLIDLPWGGEPRFLSDGRLLITHEGGKDSGRNQAVVILSPGETPEVRSFKIERELGNSRVQFSSDSRLALLTGRALVDLHLGHETFDAPIKFVNVWDGMRIEDDKQSALLSPDFKRFVRMRFQDRAASMKLAGSGNRQRFEVVDPVSGRVLWTDKSLALPTFSPDGKLLATVTPSDVRLLDAASGKEVRRFPIKFGTFYQVSFDQSQRYITAFRYIYEENRIVNSERIVWNLSTGQKVWAIQGLGFSSSPVFTADGSHLAAADFTPLRTEGGKKVEGYKVKVWNLATGKEIVSQKFVRWPRFFPLKLVFSADGKRLAVGGEETSVLDLATGKKSLANADSSGFLAFTPDSQKLLIASTKDGQHQEEVKILELASGKKLTSEIELFCLRLKESHPHTLLSPDGKWLVSTTHNRVTLWEAATGKEVRTFARSWGSSSPPTFSPDGRWVAWHNNRGEGGGPAALKVLDLRRVRPD
jgi:WD40 repeat protein